MEPKYLTDCRLTIDLATVLHTIIIIIIVIIIQRNSHSAPTTCKVARETSGIISLINSRVCVFETTASINTTDLLTGGWLWWCRLISNIEENVRLGLKDSLNISWMHLDKTTDSTMNLTKCSTLFLSNQRQKFTSSLTAVISRKTANNRFIKRINHSLSHMALTWLIFSIHRETSWIRRWNKTSWIFINF